MMPNANLLFYLNLSGEAFYIIGHRMKSQGVKMELQQKVYNDIAISICHPIVLQNLTKGALQILEMTMTDLRILMDRIVHSSIMTVNAHSMEKLFELALIATRYQYTVCQHPKDILLIALNHLDGIRDGVTDSTAMNLCDTFHRVLVERLRGESSISMQDNRFAVLTYLADVKLKMTNLIKLGYQKTTGEFVKDFPDKFTRAEFQRPGTIETFPSDRLERSDSEGSSNEFERGYSVDSELEEVPDWMQNEFSEPSLFQEKGNCHFENASAKFFSDNEFKEDEEILEIEYVENSFQEVLESSQSDLKNPGIAVKFIRCKSEDEDLPKPRLNYSFDLCASRGITLGQSIYDIPGNSDEKVGGQAEAEVESPSSDAIAVKAVRELELCSMMLGCATSSYDMDYASRLHNYASTSDPLKFEDYSKTSSASKPDQKNAFSGVNIVRFDARSDRSQSKAALSQISKQLDLSDLGPDFDTPEYGRNTEKCRDNVFDLDFQDE